MGTLEPLTGPATGAYRDACHHLDVARRAGVSIATVSRVLRGSAPVQDGTRRQVEHAVDELGFVPSRLGVSLAERRHAANGVVFPDLSGPYFAEVVLGYEEVTSRLGRSVLILSTREQADPEAAVRSSPPGRRPGHLRRHRRPGNGQRDRDRRAPGRAAGPRAGSRAPTPSPPRTPPAPSG